MNSAASPAGIGDILTLYATGEGPTSPVGLDGKVAGATPPKPLGTVSVTIGGQTARVTYAGGAPDEVAGLMQVNVEIPPGIQVGSAVPVVLRVGNSVSQPGVTVAFR